MSRQLLGNTPQEALAIGVVVWRQADAVAIAWPYGEVEPGRLGITRIRSKTAGHCTWPSIHRLITRTIAGQSSAIGRTHPSRNQPFRQTLRRVHILPVSTIYPALING